MFDPRQILVIAIGLGALGGGLAGCGQKGPLFLPKDPAASHRATLPQAVMPMQPSNAAASSTMDPSDDIDDNRNTPSSNSQPRSQETP